MPYWISPVTLLTMWERGCGLTRPAQGRTVLRVLGIQEPALGRLTVGERDVILMDLRSRVFGSHIASIARCPSCGEVLDVGFELADVCKTTPDAADGTVHVEHESFRVLARPPSLDDLDWLEDPPQGDDPRAALFGRCIVEASRAGEPVDVADIPDDVVALVARSLSDADPGADIRLELVCSTCGHRWTVVFDIVSFFWEELDAWAWRMARDVDVLAARYGWSEGEILTMHRTRRELYLEVARS